MQAAVCIKKTIRQQVPISVTDTNFSGVIKRYVHTVLRQDQLRFEFLRTNPGERSERLA